MKETTHLSGMESPLGPITFVSGTKGLREIRFMPLMELAASFNASQQGALLIDSDESPYVQQFKEYFLGQRHQFELPLDPVGTEFQRLVWNALLTIPYGQTCCYKDIAREIQCPKGARAVGQANGANPLPIVIPCHRVLAAGGKLGGYSAGLEIKQALLKLEGYSL